ncbi:MAG: FAD-binding oxidoreductase [Flavobacteriaceae bacterium]|nr:FAD-binding oxidoreductase [Flavobacteriaceae bacterium]
MDVDYIIVGLGLAGLAFAEELENNGKSFVVYENSSQNSSRVAAGVYNPVILKRFTPVWDALDQLNIALPFYRSLEKKLSLQFDEKFDIYRVFASIEEQNNWFAACDKPFFVDFMIPEIIPNNNPGINAPFGFGKIINTGKVDTTKLLRSYSKYLDNENRLRHEYFDYTELNLLTDGVKYNNVKAKKVVFCEGYGIKKNPFFENFPLKEVKGELITINAPALDIHYLLKASVFILPLGNSRYQVGATFNWKDKSLQPTPEGKKELLKKLKKVIKVDFEVVDHEAGIRPTSKDRRPILGKHQQYEQLAVLNGLGTRGVMLAPKMAKILFGHLENNHPLDKEIATGRFY